MTWYCYLYFLRSRSGKPNNNPILKSLREKRGIFVNSGCLKPCFFLLEKHCQGTTEFAQRAQEISQNNSARAFREIRQEIISQIDCPKI